MNMPLTFGMATMFLVGSMSFAAGPTITATASTDQVRVAEPFTVDVSVQAENGAKVTFPDGQAVLGDFEIRDQHDVLDVPSKDGANTRTWSRVLTLETLSTGDLQIPPINVQVSKDGNAQQLATQPLPIRVASVLEDRADPTQFRDIESVVDVHAPQTPSSSMAPWMLGGVGLTAFAALACVAIQRRRQWMTPQAWAIQQFELLDRDDESAVIQLTSIVREFLVMQYAIPDAGGTLQEITQQLLKRNGIDAAQAQRLSGLAEIADKIKFAGSRISREGLTSVIVDARSLVVDISSQPAQ